MIAYGWPGELFNPLVAPKSAALTPYEALAGPYGLILFLILIPVVRLIAPRARHAAIIVPAFAWMTLTTGPKTTAIVVAGVAAAWAWVVLLGRLVAAGRMSPRMMIALTWIGLIALVFPLWWIPIWSWYPSRFAPLHSLGLAYFLLRFIAWGVELAGNPRDALRPGATACWLLYPPIMRLGPLLLRGDFLKRFDAWQPRAAVPWKELGQRLGLFVLGGAVLVFLDRNIPFIYPGKSDFYAVPADYSTSQLVRAFYMIPTQFYVLLWTYNELACAIGIAIGIRVDSNFDWLPRATNIRDFWRRWHITVGNWLRNYIYIPLGGNRHWVPLNYAAVFLFCGIWHGASWSFVAWGALHALGLTVQRYWDRLRKRLGWKEWPSSRLWTTFCWLLTMHYAAATFVIFMDFDHTGLRFFGELGRRVLELFFGAFGS